MDLCACGGGDRLFDVLTANTPFWLWLYAVDKVLTAWLGALALPAVQTCLRACVCVQGALWSVATLTWRIDTERKHNRPAKEGRGAASEERRHQ